MWKDYWTFVPKWNVPIEKSEEEKDNNWNEKDTEKLVGDTEEKAANLLNN